MLAQNKLIDLADVVVMYENEAMYKICREKLDIKRPSFDNINSLIAKAVSSLTVLMRFDGGILCDLKEFETNCVPYPGISTLITHLTPL